MRVILYPTSLLALILGVTAEPPECPNKEAKALLQKYKVTGEITPLLKGNTFVDIFRRKATTTTIDCSMAEYTASEGGLVVNTHNVKHDGSSIFFKDKMTENKGESSFNSYGEYVQPGEEKIIFKEYVHVFYADKYVWGYFSCDTADDTLRMAISVKKEKQDDKDALASLKKAEEIMLELKDLMPDEMTRFSNEKCPAKV